MPARAALAQAVLCHPAADEQQAVRQQSYATLGNARGSLMELRLYNLLGRALLLTSSAGCLSFPASGLRIQLTSYLADSVLTVNDTLRVDRFVVNRGRRPVWVSWGTTDVPFQITDSTGRIVCRYAGVYTLGLINVQLPAGDSIPRPFAWPLRDLADCQPGTYSLTTVARFYTNEYASGRATVLTTPPTRLHIIAR
jgi:hypothetical protein